MGATTLRDKKQMFCTLQSGVFLFCVRLLQMVQISFGKVGPRSRLLTVKSVLLLRCFRWSEDDLPSCFGADRPGGPTGGAATTCLGSPGPQQGDEPLQCAAHAADVTAAAVLR